MITVSFYSYKGGVGRSLTLANLGVYLAQFGATVALVDFDLEAPGLHYKLRPGGPLSIPNAGLAGMLADLSRGRTNEEIDWDLVVDVSEHARSAQPGYTDLGGEEGRLLLIPAGNPMEQNYWSDLASIDWDSLFTSGRRRGVSAMARLKSDLEARYEPDVLLIDSRTGITPGGGIATTLLPDLVVTMMLNTPEHVDGSRLVVSAVTEVDEGADGPTVVPVLSRYPAPVADEDWNSAPRSRRMRNAPSFTGVGSAIPVPTEELWEDLTDGLLQPAQAKVKKPLVIHADPALQYQEYLIFGPYARNEETVTGQTLLEDYLKLFASLVPRDTFVKYLSGVRERARSILLDNPDDAVRALESLATLVGDKDAFVDLVKAYLLRRDTTKMLAAAESLYRVHGRIIPHPALTKELRDVEMGRGSRRLGVEPLPVSAEFSERYWQLVAGDDYEWGSMIARLHADAEDQERAKGLAEEIIDRSKDPVIAGEVIRTIALGSASAEAVAVRLSLKYFELGKETPAFLLGAALAAQYQNEMDLAELLIEAPASGSLPALNYIRLASIAGQYDEAADLLLEFLLAPGAREGDLEEHARLWERIGRQVPRIRHELRERDPELVDRLDAQLQEDPF